jgi:hypothetical protein
MKDKARLLPLLVLYVLIVLLVSSNVIDHDQLRYVGFANNLAHGYYTSRDHINLSSGPGYPILLLPFVLLNLPWVAAKLLNALLLFMAILYFHGTLRFYVNERPALYFSYLLGVYLPFLRYIHLLLTEELALFLMCGFLFHFCKLHRSGKTRWGELAIASIYLAYLALTKVFLGYVILTGLLLSMALYLWKRGGALKRTVLVSCLALACCSPYLVYTHSLTGKIFYWGNLGGSSLYWISNPNESELGAWFNPQQVLENPGQFEPHVRFFQELERLPTVRRDDELKKRAFYNITHYPRAFLKNWLANAGRLLFNYPYAYDRQKLSTYFYVIPNMFLFVLSMLLIYPTIRGRKLIPYEIYATTFFSILYLGGTSLVSGVCPRQAMLVVPVLSLWIIFTLTRVLEFKTAEGQPFSPRPA